MNMLVILSALVLALAAAFFVGLKAGARHRRRRTTLRVQSDRRPIVL